MAEKYWLAESGKDTWFGVEVEIVESLGTQDYFSERYGDCEIERLKLKRWDGKEDYAYDTDLVRVGDWTGIAVWYRNRRGRELRDDIGDILMREQTQKFGTTAPAISKELKLDIKFTRAMLARLRQFGWAAEDADMLWFPGTKLVEYRRKQEEERKALQELLAKARQ